MLFLSDALSSNRSLFPPLSAPPESSGGGVVPKTALSLYAMPDSFLSF
ncbi:hypothetical protein GLE_5510 [Lysobacter enzymogenes]|uniref:Uncharacterized protein n=1 Tax=Lysobacter enzymogenes TaxID=69 RepID=A0A0S2DQS8_LYSEN|nr:hypothetical protein GLE_5510 [Lysobacter enzymogenes]